MTTAHESCLQAECDALHRSAETQARRIADLEACKLRLNGLIVARDAEIDRLHIELAKLRAELFDARAGIVELTY